MKINTEKSFKDFYITNINTIWNGTLEREIGDPSDFYLKQPVSEGTSKAEIYRICSSIHHNFTVLTPCQVHISMSLSPKKVVDPALTGKSQKTWQSQGQKETRNECWMLLYTNTKLDKQSLFDLTCVYSWKNSPSNGLSQHLTQAKALSSRCVCIVCSLRHFSFSKYVKKKMSYILMASRFQNYYYILKVTSEDFPMESYCMSSQCSP